MTRFVVLSAGALVLFAVVWPAAQADDRFMTIARTSLAQLDGEARLPGLVADVEVIRDRWGVPHIYASNMDDLFRAQGYVMAQDRLWQMEMWRRQREGRLAEIVGPEAVERDRQARLLSYRGPMDEREWTAYHPEGRRIFEAYAAGVNAFIDSHRDNLPVEFVVTGIQPTRWTAETLVLRTATFGNATAELALGRNVAQFGVDEANRLDRPDPPAALVVPDGLDVAALAEVRTGGRGGRGRGGQPDLIEPYRSWRGASVLALRDDAGAIDGPEGSNNWVVSGRLSATGSPVVVNDPHREVTNPSLRYIVHLHAPGWNVIGAGEPPFVGVAIGHNDRLGWGLTIVGTDQEDVYVEQVNPANALEVRWQEGWDPVRVVGEEIAVRGGAPVMVELKFSRHGPIFHEDRERHLAYALRSALLEPGTAPYLGSLRLAQARDCRAFLGEARYWHFPSENLVCGDVDGNIAWVAAALTPNRQNGKWSGRLPVPGDGRYEWDGFRTDLPTEFNPARGFVATANHNIQPPGFSPPIMFKRQTDQYQRIDRLLQLIRPGATYTLDDHRRMQIDALSLRAQAELALFRGWTSPVASVERARAMLAAWNAVYDRDSAPAAIYSAWRTASSADERDTARPASQLRTMHETSLAAAIASLTTSQGADWSAWRWGRMHTRSFPHAFLPAWDLPTVERPGGAGTVAADGASYREIFDVADWDRSMVTNTPGQSGQPGSPFYGNLLTLWADDQYVPLVYSRTGVDEAGAHRLRLKP
ncbi:MAG TPA: penicillin acylase family protein [Vicinamibacterales bacterium]|nr:penicillin acylase family protein [Vicinamibacterales bacterium]